MNESVENWADLESRDKIRLYSNDHIEASGSVDGVMPDGSALWLVQDAFPERALFLESDGLSAVRMSEQTSSAHMRRPTTCASLFEILARGGPDPKDGRLWPAVGIGEALSPSLASTCRSCGHPVPSTSDVAWAALGFTVGILPTAWDCHWKSAEGEPCACPDASHRH